MPSMTCACGDQISWTEIPCPVEYLFISDTDFDRFHGKVDSEQIYQAMTSLMRCPSCDRLWVFWNGTAAEPTLYEPGNGNDASDSHAC